MDSARSLDDETSVLARRVLMIAPTSFFADSGCHVRILEETRTLQRLGCQVAICTYHTGRDVDGLDIRRTGPLFVHSKYEVGTARHKVAFDALLFFRAWAACRSFRPQVIHAHLHEGALIGLVLSRLLRIPLIFDFQGSLTSEMVDNHFLSRDGLAYGPLRRLERYIDQHVPQIITSSTHAAELVCSEFGCDPERVMSIVDCVDLDTFYPRQDEEERHSQLQALGIPEGRHIIVYLGKLAEYQGTRLLIEAVQELCRRRDDLHFVIAGYPSVDVYKALAFELSIADHCTFTGRVDYEHAADILKLGDIAVSPKVSKTEGAGKLLNYMAMGLPTIAFDNGVSREYLGDLGVYAPTGDVAALAEQISLLIDDEPRRCELAVALRQRASMFSWDEAGHRILERYGAAAEMKNGPRK